PRVSWVTTCTSACGRITGGVLSTNSTKTSNVVSAAWFPAASCAEQMTVVWPSANGVPASGEQLTATAASWSSVAAGEVYVTATPVAWASCVTTWTASCNPITGGSVSADGQSSTRRRSVTGGGIVRTPLSTGAVQPSFSAWTT